MRIPTGPCSRLNRFLGGRMWFPNSIQLSSADERTAFLLLAWQELFDPHTPDSYRPRLFDILGFLEEIRAIARQAESDERWIKHLPPLVKEMQFFLSENPLVQKHYPKIHKALMSLSKDTRPGELRATTAVALGEMDNYPSLIREHLFDCLSKLPRTKGDMLKALSMLATRVRAEGVHEQQCTGLDFDSLLEKTPDQALNAIIDSSAPLLDDWECIISLRGKNGEHRSILEKSPFRALAKSQKPKGAIGDRFLNETEGENQIRAITTIRARGAREATSIAAESIQKLVDFANFFHNSNAIKLSNRILAQKGRTQVLLNLRHDTMFTLKPRRRAAHLPSEILTKLPLDLLPAQLTNALEQHTFAQNSNDLKVRFVNLWVALETLVGKGDGSIIDRVVKSISPILVNTRSKRILKHLAISLAYYGLFDHTPDCRPHFERSTPWDVRRDELLLILNGVFGPKAQKDLCKAVAPHKLLLFRVYLAHQTLSSPKSMLKSYQSSLKRCEWQLRRIYRERNLLVHNGDSTASLSYLIDNLNYYFNSAVSAVIDKLTQHNNWSVDECFKSIGISLDHFMWRLSDSPKEITLAEALNCGGPYMDRQIFKID